MRVQGLRLYCSRGFGGFPLFIPYVLNLFHPPNPPMAEKAEKLEPGRTAGCNGKPSTYFRTRMGFSFLMLRKMRVAIPVRAVMRKIISIGVFEVPAVMGRHPMPRARREL